MFKLVVLFSVAALGAAKPGYVAAPVAYSAVLPATSSVSQYSSSVVHGSPVVPYSAPVYSGVAPVALAQAPYSPAVVLDAVHGVPLDTPEVVAARAAHYQARALSGLHYRRKRSAVYSSVVPVAHGAVVAPVSTYSAPLVSAYSSPLVSAYSSPVVSAYSSPVVSAYSSPVVSGYSPLFSGYSAPLAYSGVYPKALSVHPY